MNHPHGSSGPESLPTRPRRWWLAAVLQLLSGAGYLYVGRPFRFAALFAFNCASVIALYHGLWGWFGDAFQLLGSLAAQLGVVLITIVDCIRIALKSKPYQLKEWNRWWVYALPGVSAFFIVAIVMGSLGRTEYAVSSFSIASGNNMPTLLVGDYVLADTIAYTQSVPERGDIAIYRLPRDHSIFYVGRVVGLPGERIQMTSGVLHIDRSPVQLDNMGTFEHNTPGRHFTFSAELQRETLPGGHTHLVADEGTTPLDNTEEFIVPQGHYFALGDNRDNSQDSRVLRAVGFVPRENFYGPVTSIWWSPDMSRIGLRPQ